MSQCGIQLVYVNMDDNLEGVNYLYVRPINLVWLLQRHVKTMTPTARFIMSRVLVTRLEIVMISVAV